jgi:hypothetical protein
VAVCGAEPYRQRNFNCQLTQQKDGHLARCKSEDPQACQLPCTLGQCDAGIVAHDSDRNDGGKDRQDQTEHQHIACSDFFGVAVHGDLVEGAFHVAGRSQSLPVQPENPESTLIR